MKGEDGIMAELDELRQKLDSIDSRIIDAFEDRMKTVRKIAEYKLKNGLRVLDRSRELEVLEDRAARLRNKELSGDVKKLFELLMDVSRSYQRAVMQKYHKPENGRMLEVAFQGERGANSEAVLKFYFGENVREIGCLTFEDVFSIVEYGKVKYGVLPVENSSTGGIVQVYDLLDQYDVYIVGEQQMLIEHNLLGLPGTDIADIKDVYSHEQALMQCADFLAEHKDMEQHPYFNTAVSAKFIAEQGIPSYAAIASSYAAKLYGLEVLAPDISTCEDNTTRFIIISAEMEFFENADKASVSFVLEHRSGALAKVLDAFAGRNLNMVKIESRPLENRNFEYVFYVDFEGNNIKENMADVFEENKDLFIKYKVLGIYKKREVVQF